ncbi:hypothetical protein FHX64_000366 [Microbacter margulisiae]|uniref:Alpha-L-fucosidase n=2 Tax=Microbacter margulisiae TaxID=1350067 RepID=A0A7W5DP80_9PORP|nr:hypothetical protein [Microbacter margulisiae]
MEKLIMIKKKQIIENCLIVFVFLAFSFHLKAQKDTLRSNWMVGKWGIMVHWIAPGPAPAKGPWIKDLNTAVNNFNLNRFLSQVKESGADYLVFTIGQNTGYYTSPNATLDSLVGYGHCSKRDLVLEIAEGIHHQRKRFIAYLPGEIMESKSLHKGFGWNAENQNTFQYRYTDFIRCYSLKFGKLLDGWWFDGCYNLWAAYYIPRDWKLWTSAARAGNTDAVVAYNDGSFYVGSLLPIAPYPYQDYLSGECWKFWQNKIVVGHEEPTFTTLPSSRFVKGTQCQFHVMLPIDCNKDWMHDTPGKMPPPSYTDNELFPAVLNVLKVGGTVTLNVGIYQEGYISSQTLDQLKRLNKYIKNALYK